MEKFNVCFFVLLVSVILCVQDVTSQLTLAKLSRKVNNQGKKLNNLMGELRKIQDDQTGFSNELESVKTAMANMGHSVNNLDDKPECPGNTGFYMHQSLGSCYRLENISVMVNVTQAERMCQAYSPNSHLVAIESEAEQSFLRDIWKNKYGQSSISRYWTAASLTNGDWLWPYGKEVKYENWVPTTEHNDDRFPCMAVYSTENYWWVDVACWATHAVTCEIPL